MPGCILNHWILNNHNSLQGDGKSLILSWKMTNNEKKMRNLQLWGILSWSPIIVLMFNRAQLISVIGQEVVFPFWYSYVSDKDSNKFFDVTNVFLAVTSFYFKDLWKERKKPVPEIKPGIYSLCIHSLLGDFRCGQKSITFISMELAKSSKSLALHEVQIKSKFRL